ncbi:MAG: adenylate/guanylate cyclase domain-containing protein [Fimbriimonadaceae bacterium]|nr:adenylate/guanylate cyclase domain-containing protein [Fimbriimonadaceae bacterium]
MQTLGLSILFSGLINLIIGPVTRLPLWAAALVYGFAFAGAFITIDLTGLDGWRLKTYFLTSIVRTLTYMVGVFIAFFVGVTVNISIVTRQLPWQSADVRGIIWNILSQTYFLGSGAAALCAAFLVNAVQAIARKLGPGVLTNWVRGYYHEPREEVRIFMFLDMKDSTTLAEQLGHLRFSALVRDFMADLTDPILETDAEVSHYIGDEVVITWTMPKGLDRANCLRLFRLFRTRLTSRAPSYKAKYGVVPDFKAGAHCGAVVATEVGEIKSEIVYHGDVLNTAARIQAQCNTLNCDFLISGELAGMITSPEFRTRPRGLHTLKGRVQPVELVEVQAVEPA